MTKKQSLASLWLGALILGALTCSGYADDAQTLSMEMATSQCRDRIVGPMGPVQCAQACPQGPQKGGDSCSNCGLNIHNCQCDNICHCIDCTKQVPKQSGSY
jgi:hypothetical protein